MSPLAKSVMVIVATFAIGIAVGALLDASLARGRIEQVREFRGGLNLLAPLERIIEPTDEEQRQAIRTVLERATARNAHVYERTRIGMMAAMDSLRAELEPLLTEEQRARLDRFSPSGGRMRRGPGPGRRPFPRGPDGARGRSPGELPPFERPGRRSPRNR